VGIPPVTMSRPGLTAGGWAHWTKDFDWSIELERVIDAGGNRVVGMFHQRAIGKASGVPVELHMGLVYELEDGRIIRMRNFLDPAEALETAGLSE
jgi:ketosteroid isomerase-like protein